MPTTRFVWDYDNDAYLNERSGDGTSVATYTCEPVQFGELISMRASGASLYFHADGSSSIRELSDGGQATVDEYVFTAFGNTVAVTGSTKNAFKFIGAVGYYEDGYVPDITVMYARSRFMCPDVARWISSDPADDRTHRESLYAYAGNNPISRIDPSGMAWQYVGRCAVWALRRGQRNACERFLKQYSWAEDLCIKEFEETGHAFIELYRSLCPERVMEIVNKNDIRHPLLCCIVYRATADVSWENPDEFLNGYNTCLQWLAGPRWPPSVRPIR